MSHTKNKSSKSNRCESTDEVIEVTRGRAPVSSSIQKPKRTRDDSKSNRHESSDEVIEVARGRAPVYSSVRTLKRARDKFTLDISQILNDNPALRHSVERSPLKSKITVHERSPPSSRTVRQSDEKSPLGNVYAPRSGPLQRTSVELDDIMQRSYGENKTLKKGNELCILMCF